MKRLFEERNDMDIEKAIQGIYEVLENMQAQFETQNELNKTIVSKLTGMDKNDL
jgi:hypothetical protein